MMNYCFKIILICSAISAQIENVQTITKTGTTVAQFLKIGIDARGSAMGGAVVGQSGNLSSVYWNPAGLVRHNGVGAQFGSHDWLAAMKFQYAVSGIELKGKGVLGLWIVNLSSPEDLVRTVAEPEGTGEKFVANDLSAAITYAKMLTDNFALGGSVKYIQLNIWHTTARTVAVDLGALFTTPFKGIRLGASISNYGGKMKMDGRDQKIGVDPDPVNQGNVEFVNAYYETEYFPIPLFFRVGFSGEIINSDKLKLMYGLDALHPNDNSEYVNLGVEATFNNFVSLRAGYPSLFKDDSIEGPTFGAGLNYRVWRTSTILKIDYSIADFGPLGSVERLSVGFNI